MDKKEILEFINANKLFTLATIDGDSPRVRGMLLHKADESGIYFTTGKMRDLYRQLKTNTNIELCFFSDYKQVRVSGIAEELDHDLELKKEILAARPFMQPWIDAAGFEPMAVFRLVKGVATSWRFDRTLAPKEFIQLT